MANSPIYIPSKGRPWCVTAHTLLEMDNPIDFTIVCGDNDGTIPEYVSEFGEDRVTVFDHSEWWDKCDMMDAYGRSKPSGITPARNFIVWHARQMGYDRCWQIDDDMDGFMMFDGSDYVGIHDGITLGRQLGRVDELAEMLGSWNVGIPGWSFSRSKTRPAMVTHEVCCLHNVTTRLSMPYKGRMFDDAVFMFDSLRKGNIQYVFYTVTAHASEAMYGTALSKSASGGGMKELYDDTADNRHDDTARDVVQVRNMSFIQMVLPKGSLLNAAKKNGRLGKWYRDKEYRPKIVSERWVRTDA